jgi:GTP-binding protein
MSKEPRIVVIGRPNVGKSTLFNRLVGHRRALVHDEPGVTRDRLEVKTTWWVRARPMPVMVVDTGGVGGERFAEEIEKQVGIALEEADCVLLVFDGAAGRTPADEELLKRLQQSGIMKRLPMIGVINKVDAEMHEDRINDFYSAGLDRLVTISAEHGRGIDDLEAEALNYEFSDVQADEEAAAAAEAEAAAEFERQQELELDEDLEGEIEDESLDRFDDEFDDEPETTERKVPRVTIMGRPNVGKSTLINALLREDRMITSPIAGTTVDSIDSVVKLGDKPFVFVDTAGIRRKSKTERGIEVLSVVQSRKALESSDVVVLMIDGEGGMTDQDEKIGGLIENAGVSVIIAVNKWDTQRKTPEFTREIAADAVRKEMGFLRWAPILFMSAKEGRGIDDLGDLIDEILAQRRLKLATKELTEWVRRQSDIHNPQNAKFFLAHQSGRHPPTFVFHVNDPERVHFSLRRHLANNLRERWGYMGSPVRLLFVEAHNRKSMRKKYKPRPSAAPKAADSST